MFDLHCHLPFAISDGPETSEESENMLAVEAASGVKFINAVAHYGRGGNTDIDKLLSTRVEALRPAAQKLGITLHAGYEYDFNDLADAGDHLLTVADGSRYLLVDFCSSELPYFAANRFFQLANQGYQVIVVHPEVLFSHRELKKLASLRNAEAVIQLNAVSFLPESDAHIRKMAHDLVASGLAQLVASDAHRIDGRRRCVLAEARDAVAAEFGENAARLLFEVNPERVATNRYPLELNLPPLSWFQRFRMKL